MNTNFAGILGKVLKVVIPDTYVPYDAKVKTYVTEKETIVCRLNLIQTELGELSDLNLKAWERTSRLQNESSALRSRLRTLEGLPERRKNPVRNYVPAYPLPADSPKASNQKE